MAGCSPRRSRSRRPRTGGGEAAGLARTINRPDADGVALAADRAAGWARLGDDVRRRSAAGGDRAVGLSRLSAASIAHAVGLDSFASLSRDPASRCTAGRLSTPSHRCPTSTSADPDALCHDAPTPILSRDDYARSAVLRASGLGQGRRRWTAPGARPDGTLPARGAASACAISRSATSSLAIQPDRGSMPRPQAPATTIADTAGAPRVSSDSCSGCATRCEIHALLHLGTHGTLEWLPGKASAPSADCSARGAHCAACR